MSGKRVGEEDNGKKEGRLRSIPCKETPHVFLSPLPSLNLPFQVFFCLFVRGPLKWPFLLGLFISYSLKTL